mmetsp:Transcript_7676/g.19372  ORF Transcript_7676/g.19372 Transcript_7676/m.19372 type:complete len:265 (-) Transcript_7676:1328-2122(-)
MPLLDTDSLVDELQDLDLSALIGGPLTAVVKAQAQAAFTTIAFVREFGFVGGKDKGDWDTPVMVKFEYERPVKADWRGNEKMAWLEGMTHQGKSSIEVPLLTMMPIPALRVELMEISFIVKLDSVQTYEAEIQEMAMGMDTSAYDTSSDSSHNVGKTSLSGKKKETQSSLSGSFQTQKTDVASKYSGSRVQSRITRTYHLDINLTAKGDEMPAGLEKLFEALEANMIDTVAQSKQPVPLPGQAGGVADAAGGGNAGGADAGGGV